VPAAMTATTAVLPGLAGLAAVVMGLTVGEITGHTLQRLLATTGRDGPGGAP